MGFVDRPFKIRLLSEKCNGRSGPVNPWSCEMARFSHVGGALRDGLPLLRIDGDPGRPILFSDPLLRRWGFEVRCREPGPSGLLGNRVGTWVLGTTPRRSPFQFLGQQAERSVPNSLETWRFFSQIALRASSPGAVLFNSRVPSEVGTGCVLRCANSSGGGTNRSAPSSSRLELAVSTGP